MIYFVLSVTLSDSASHFKVKDSNFHYRLLNNTLAGEKNLSVHENSSNWIVHILESYVELKLVKIV